VNKEGELVVEEEVGDGDEEDDEVDQAEITGDAGAADAGTADDALIVDKSAKPMKVQPVKSKRTVSTTQFSTAASAAASVNMSDVCARFHWPPIPLLAPRKEPAPAGDAPVNQEASEAAEMVVVAVAGYALASSPSLAAGQNGKKKKKSKKKKKGKAGASVAASAERTIWCGVVAGRRNGSLPVGYRQQLLLAGQQTAAEDAMDTEDSGASHGRLLSLASIQLTGDGGSKYWQRVPVLLRRLHKHLDTKIGLQTQPMLPIVTDMSAVAGGGAAGVITDVVQTSARSAVKGSLCEVKLTRMAPVLTIVDPNAPEATEPAAPALFSTPGQSPAGSVLAVAFRSADVGEDLTSAILQRLSSLQLQRQQMQARDKKRKEEAEQEQEEDEEEVFTSEKKISKFIKQLKHKALVDLLSEMKDQGFKGTHKPCIEQMDPRWLFAMPVPCVESAVRLEMERALAEATEALTSMVPTPSSTLTVPNPAIVALGAAPPSARLTKAATSVLLPGLETEGDTEGDADEILAAAGAAGVPSIPTAPPSFVSGEGSSEDAPPLWLWRRADCYFYRNIAELQQLRVSLQTCESPDISLAEARRLLAVSEQLFGQTVQQRLLLHSVASAHLRLLHCAVQLEAVTHAARRRQKEQEIGSQIIMLPTQMPARMWLSGQHERLASLQLVLEQLHALLQGAHDAAEASGECADDSDDESLQGQLTATKKTKGGKKRAAVAAAAQHGQLPALSQLKPALLPLLGKAAAEIHDSVAAVRDARAGLQSFVSVPTAAIPSARTDADQLLDAQRAKHDKQDKRKCYLATDMRDADAVATQGSTAASNCVVGDDAGAWFGTGVLAGAALQQQYAANHCTHEFAHHDIDDDEDADGELASAATSANEQPATVVLIPAHAVSLLRSNHRSLLRGFIHRMLFDEASAVVRLERDGGFATEVANGVRECLSRMLEHEEEQQAALDANQAIVEADDSASNKAAQTKAFDNAIGAVLMSTQKLCGLREEIAKQSGDAEDGPNTASLTAHHNWLFGAARRLSVAGVAEATEKLLMTVGGNGAESFEAVLLADRLRPMLQHVRATSRELLLATLRHHKGSSKLLYVVSRLSRSLVTHGFCDDSAEEGGNGEGGQMEDDVEGTGMGSGEGKEDVSEQIEDEEQLLGLKGDEQDQKPDDEQKADDTGVEMDNDFEGEMFDLDKDEEQEQEEEKDNDEEEEEELDREMGDLNEDEQVVDEKMWDDEDESEDEDGEDQEKEKDKFEKDAEVEGEEANTDELRTKDDEESAEGKDKDDQQKEEDGKDEEEEEKDEKKKQEPEEDEEEEEDEFKEHEVNDDNEDDYEENQGTDPQKKDEPEELELPDDMDLEQEGEDEEPEEMGQDGEDGEDAEEKEGGDEAKEAEEGEEKEGEEEKKEGEDDEGEGEDNEKEGEEDEELSDTEGGVGGADNDIEEEENDEENEHAPPDNSAEQEEQQEDAVGVKGAGPGFQDKEEKEEAGGDDGDDEEEQAVEEDNAPVAQPEEDEGGAEEEQKKESVADSEGQEWQQREQEEKEDDGGGGDEDKEDEETNEDGSNQQKEANPLKSAGDAMKHWERKLELLQQPMPDDNEKDDGEDGAGDDEEEKEQDQPESGPQEDQPEQRGTFEIVEKEEDSTTQALGPAMSEEQLEQVPTQKQGEEDDEDEDEDDKGDEGKMGEDEDEEDKDGKQDPAEDDNKPPPKPEPQEKESDGKVRENEGKKQDTKQDKKRKREGDDEKGGEDQMPEDEKDGEDGEDDDGMDLMPEDEEVGRGEDGATVITNINEEEEDDDDEGSRKRALEREMELRQKQEEEQRQLTPADMARLRDDATRRLQEWEREEGGRSLSHGEELWGYYQRLTAGSAQRLCEQLRLVLEPTLRSKMQGDYRTGKRVNMRKVITYIASQYRKDKIWMRRTKPAKRQYQVLLAIDDSLSMRDNRAGALALEAMAVISQALTQLEAGELAVASFGEQTELLHPFGAPFAGTAPAHVLSSFTFRQGQTNTAQSLELLLQQLTIAGGASMGRAGAASGRTLARGGGGSGGSSSGKPLQLMLVISDGIINEDGARERIRMLMRDAAARRQLLVLIVIDKDGSAEDELRAMGAPAGANMGAGGDGAGAGASDSKDGVAAAKPTAKPKESGILHTQTATFEKGRLVFKSYLDSYPFPYYILIREVEALPTALSDALRQWFEMMQRSD
jgi:hypothetical protein